MGQVISYSALLSACEKGKQPERAWDIFQDMQQQSLLPDVIMYGALLSAGEKRERASGYCSRALSEQWLWCINKLGAFENLFQGVIVMLIICTADCIPMV